MGSWALTLCLVRLQRRRFLIALVPALLLFGLFSAFTISHLVRGPHTYLGRDGLQTMAIDHLANGTFYAERISLDWLAEG